MELDGLLGDKEELTQQHVYIRLVTLFPSVASRICQERQATLPQ